MSELKPCPFCGGEAMVFGYHDVFWEAECLRCHGAAGNYETKAEAIDAWNTRADSIVRCRDCKQAGDNGAYCLLHRLPIEPDGFCKWGEAR